ncbi:hypothetical protein HK102_012945 [Quaeritorhiza haematococci]|nr:hypothetical protein HK102_012945 [Quaeritorhiza haematococci]
MLRVKVPPPRIPHPNLNLIILLLAFTTQHSFAANVADYPSIDWGNLGLLVGQFDSASAFASISLQTQQTTPRIILRHADGRAQELGGPTEGLIRSVCAFPDKPEDGWFLAGNFSAVGDAKEAGVARFNRNEGGFTATTLGFGGDFRTVLCDSLSGSVFIGGEFSTAAGMGSRGESFLSLNIVRWYDGSWEPMPMKGLNGMVRDLLVDPSGDGIVVGGDFTATGDGTEGLDPLAQSVNYIGMVSSSDTSDSLDAEDLACGTKGKGWTINKAFNPAAPLHSLRFTLRFPVTITAIVLKATNSASGTQLFRRPNTHLHGFVSARVQIDPDNILHTFFERKADFKIRDYDVVVHAFSDNNPSCTIPDAPTPFLPTVTATGPWQQTPDFSLSMTLNPTTPPPEDTSLRFTPFISDEGTYDVVIHTPPCGVSDVCGRRGTLRIQVFTQNAREPATTLDLDQNTISSNNTAPDGTLVSVVYTGNVVATSADFQPFVVVSLVGSGVNASTLEVVTVVVKSVEFLKKPSVEGLNGLVKLGFVKDGSSGGIADYPWQKLPDLPAGLKVKNMAFTKDGQLVVHGEVSGKVPPHQILLLRDGTFQTIPEPGLSGNISSLVVFEDKMFIAGSFSAFTTSGGFVMQHIGEYDFLTQRWSALDGGVNNPVESLVMDASSSLLYVRGYPSSMLSPIVTLVGNGSNPSSTGPTLTQARNNLAVWQVGADGGNPNPTPDGVAAGYWTINEFIDGPLDFLGILSSSSSPENTTLIVSGPVNSFASHYSPNVVGFSQVGMSGLFESMSTIQHENATMYGRFGSITAGAFSGDGVLFVGGVEVGEGNTSTLIVRHDVSAAGGPMEQLRLEGTGML